MYDILETDLSFKYLSKVSKFENAVIAGGWAVYFYIKEGYRRAFGLDCLKSRDIDVFVKSKGLPEFIKEIAKLKFNPSAYFFRYELIYSRTKNKIIRQEEAKKSPIYDLIYVFLDLFTGMNSEKAWYIPILNKTKVEVIDRIKVVDINTLLELKCFSFFEREKLDKELKDACDIYALLIYSNRKYKISKNIKEAIKKIINRRDLSEFISEHVLRDVTKVNIVISSLKSLI